MGDYRDDLKKLKSVYEPLEIEDISNPDQLWEELLLSPTQQKEGPKMTDPNLNFTDQKTERVYGQDINGVKVPTYRSAIGHRWKGPPGVVIGAKARRGCPPGGKWDVPIHKVPLDWIVRKDDSKGARIKKDGTLATPGEKASTVATPREAYLIAYKFLGITPREDQLPPPGMPSYEAALNPHVSLSILSGEYPKQKSDPLQLSLNMEGLRVTADLRLKTFRQKVDHTQGLRDQLTLAESQCEQDRMETLGFLRGLETVGVRVEDLVEQLQSV